MWCNDIAFIVGKVNRNTDTNQDIQKSSSNCYNTQGEVPSNTWNRMCLVKCNRLYKLFFNRCTHIEFQILFDIVSGNRKRTMGIFLACSSVKDRRKVRIPTILFFSLILSISLTNISHPCLSHTTMTKIG